MAGCLWPLHLLTTGSQTHLLIQNRSVGQAVALMMAPRGVRLNGDAPTATGEAGAHTAAQAAGSGAEFPRTWQVLQPPAEGVFHEASSPGKCLLRSSASLWSLNGSRHTELVVPSNPQIFFPGRHTLRQIPWAPASWSFDTDVYSVRLHAEGGLSLLALAAIPLMSGVPQAIRHARSLPPAARSALRGTAAGAVHSQVTLIPDEWPDQSAPPLASFDPAWCQDHYNGPLPQPEGRWCPKGGAGPSWLQAGLGDGDLARETPALG